MLALVMEVWRWIRRIGIGRLKTRDGNVFIENGIWII